jgi:hypothetical protein
MGSYMKLLGAVLLAFIALVEMALIGRGQEVHPAPEQKLFSNSPFQHPVTLSTEVLKVLLAAHPAKETFAVLNDSERTNASQLFEAGEVHLNGPDEVDLIVIGMGRMRGTDNSWFWVVRSARKYPEIILFSGGDSLEVLDSKTHGYRDIRAVWMSSLETETTTYHFDGHSYQMRNADNFKILVNPTSP